MILSDKNIAGYIQRGTLINPNKYNIGDRLQPASIDLTLGDEFKTLKKEQGLTMDREPEYKTHKSKGFYLPAKQFCLATTAEKINLPNNVSAFVEGRSSIGRMGLFIQNAGWVDPGFTGQITLELFNASDNLILLEPGRRVCQLVFAELKSPAKFPYNGKYQNQSGVVGSKINQDFEVKKEA